MPKIERVAVLGAGTMGSQIAALFANANVPSVLLDIPAKEAEKNAIALRAVERMRTQKQSVFFLPRLADLVEAGNLDDNLPRLKECDWIIEAVPEDLAVKRAAWARALPHCRADAILSSNTSGLELAAISLDFPPSAKERFLGIHFFNPPRQLHLLELIPCRETDKKVIRLVENFSERVLGKGIVHCNDTPGFVANRIGSFFSATVQKTMVEGGYSIEEADALTGPLIGVPKSASFRLIDIIGLDVWAQVARNIYVRTNDVWRERFLPMPYMNAMLQRGQLGEKAGQGFYKRVGAEKEIHVLDWKTLKYHAAIGASFDSVESVKRNPDTAARIHYLIGTNDRAGHFVWEILRDVFAYSIAMVPEIADSAVEIDRAMRWGFGHKLGPFELWDALGFQGIAKRMEGEGMRLPDNLTRMLSAGATSFYRNDESFDLTTKTFIGVKSRPGVLRLKDVKKSREVDKNAEASLIDIDDGVLCLQFHSKMNAIGHGTLRMINRGVELLAEDFEALIIANESENFSVGANLMTLLSAAQEKDFLTIETFIRNFQSALLALKYAPKPVVAAAFSRALGGGCEVVLQSHRVQALNELYIGLVELSVGLIPAGGGTKELAMRFADPLYGLNLLATAKVSGSAAEARELGFLQATDRTTANPDFLIGNAKAFALELTKEDRMTDTKPNIRVSGESGYQRMLQEIERRHLDGKLTAHDGVVLEKLAYVLSGGRVSEGSAISEKQLLDLEVEVFLSLCGMPKTQERIRHMLQNGKPLTN